MNPIDYTDELGLSIVEALANGKPLTEIAKLEGMPSLRTLYRWSSERPEFRKLYLQAREDLAHTLFAECITIAEERPVIVDDGVERVDPAGINRNRERIRAREHAASKLLPKDYGDKLQIGGAEGLPPVGAPIDVMAVARRMAFIFAGAAREMDKHEAATPALLTHEPRPEPSPQAKAPPGPTPFYPCGQPSEDATDDVVEMASPSVVQVEGYLEDPYADGLSTHRELGPDPYSRWGSPGEGRWRRG